MQNTWSGDKLLITHSSSAVLRKHSLSVRKLQSVSMCIGSTGLQSSKCLAILHLIVENVKTHINLKGFNVLGKKTKPWISHRAELDRQLTLSCCFSEYLLRSKCQISQWPTLAHDLSGLPRKVLNSQPLNVPFHSVSSCLDTGCHAVSSTNLQKT